MPASRTHRATPSGVISSATPSASRTSAEPEAELAARPPCLQITPPAPATTKAAVVETLMLWLRSPPVPHVQIAAFRVASSSGTETPNSSIVDNTVASSPTDSPLVRMPTANAAIWPDVASPRRISENAARSNAGSSSPPAVIRDNTAGHPPCVARFELSDRSVSASREPEGTSAGYRRRVLTATRFARISYATLRR